MRTWTSPSLPALPGKGQAPRLYNTAAERLEHPPLADERATLYVCGVTPYDATHLGHAATYLAFDLMQRAWRDAGIEVVYAQNITDIDDPLLERAKSMGVDWRALADDQINLFRSDMYRLAMLPPDHYVAVTESIDEISAAVHSLLRNEVAYRVETEDAQGDDIYFDTRAAEQLSEWRLGDVAPYDKALMTALSAERGGDPERPGKRHPLDPLLWRAVRDGEPSWQSPVGEGRPGWHIECAVIAIAALGHPFTVQGGGSDLIFPHHEFTAAHATALSGTPLAHSYCHAGLISYQGHKMSKSRGNLVFVSKLLDAGAEPSAIRLALLAHHYRSEWEWFDEDLATATRRLAAWREGVRRESNNSVDAHDVLSQLRQALSNDLDAPVMLAVLDAALDRGVDNPQMISDAVQSLLGVTLEVAEPA